MPGRGPGRSYGARPPSHAAYFVALGGVVALLAALLLYCAYYCCAKVKELQLEELSPVPSATNQPYPVQPGVREGAQAMAKMCRHLPSNVKSLTTAPRDLISPSTGDTSVASRTNDDSNSKNDVTQTTKTTVTYDVSETSQCDSTASKIMRDAISPFDLSDSSNSKNDVTQTSKTTVTYDVSETSQCDSTASKSMNVISPCHDVSENSRNESFTSKSNNKIITASKATLNSDVMAPSFVSDTNLAKTHRCKNNAKFNTQASITNVTSLNASENSVSLSTAAVCGSDLSDMSHSDARDETSDIFDDSSTSVSLHYIDSNIIQERYKIQ